MWQLVMRSNGNVVGVGTQEMMNTLREQFFSSYDVDIVPQPEPERTAFDDIADRLIAAGLTGKKLTRALADWSRYLN